MTVSHTREATALLGAVGVVIVTYQSAPTIRAALASLPIESLAAVVVVDNASSDPSRNIVRGHLGVTLIENPSNVGFGAACNIGVRALPDHARFVLFLNPDAAIEWPSLLRLARHLERHSGCAIAGPRLFRDGEALTSAGRRATLRSELRIVAPAPVQRRVAPRRYPPEYNEPGPVGYVEGACFLVRRTALEAIGGFDERYFLFYEELDLARRLEAQRWTVELCPEATADHLGAASRRSLADAARSYLVSSAATYLRAWHGPMAARLFMATDALTRTIRARRQRR